MNCDYCKQLLPLKHIVDPCNLRFCTVICLNLFEDKISDVIRDEIACKIMEKRANDNLQ